MEGIFLRRKFNGWLYLLFVCGLCFIGLYIFLEIVDSEVGGELLAFLFVGILICLITVPSWFLNFGAFFYVDQESVKAKYHWFGRIDCKLSEVSFALAQANTLIIQLKSGKTYTIMGLENAWQLASVLRRNMPFDGTEPPAILIKRRNNLHSVRKKWLVFVCIGLALMFINIFITVFLTGEREMHEFGERDWIVFAIMGLIETVTVITTLFLAQRAGKNNVPLGKLNYEIKRRIVETHPLLPGFVVAVFADDNYTGRITVFGDPNNNAVFYAVQEFAAEDTLIKVYESEVYEDITKLPEAFKALIDITEKVLH